ncbi:S-4TM family putative pore-forming effector [Ralstonia nicotianae]|uniref:Transmembrane protein n=1 Tax=Ralstonia solanacearum TaxID=305 RepID=A0ABY6NCP3_RALSL|nr:MULTISPECIES: S-4TM family putative pore-forming effector [Ralstonia]QKZ26402.1 hypothetical protein HWE45_01120 [Ralstonia solanacearum]UZF25176.1 hypothetical protein LGV80_01005 [Ralstonia sp. RS642]QKZ31393.1 hypothetical protein HWE47_01120 [Ralstonia solanacearum]QMT10834.1 hypothetical protein H2F19_01030 [Ralstonia solanacearum]QWF11460.1 hypothetical protein KME70_16225 [Ralstonia solanacearum]
MQETNNIPTDQARPDLVRLIWARDHTYRRAKLALGFFVLASIALPVASAFFSASHPHWKPVLAFFGLCLLFLDVAFLDRLQKERLKRGAKLQEEFDTKVFQLPWNNFVAGDKVAPEDVNEATAKPLSNKRREEIETWYEICVARVPLHVGRLICQRTNINYDSRLRRRYGNYLLWVTILVGVVLLTTALVIDPKFGDVIMAFGVPFTPVMTWALREHRRQVDTANALLNLQSEFKKLWARALSGATPQELTTGSRELQDAIYQHRGSAPLVFDWVYRRLRSRNEQEAHHAAEELVKEMQSTLGTGDRA